MEMKEHEADEKIGGFTGKLWQGAAYSCVI